MLTAKLSITYLHLSGPGHVPSLSWQQSQSLPEAFLIPSGGKPSLEPRPLRLCHLQAARGDKYPQQNWRHITVFGTSCSNGFCAQLLYLVVYVAVGKHCVEVLDTFLGIPVVTVLKPFLDCSQVHRCFDYCVIVLKRLHTSIFKMSKCKENYHTCLFKLHNTIATAIQLSLISWWTKVNTSSDIIFFKT